MRIVCDVDGVVAALVEAVLARYNAAYNDTLTPDRLTSWGIHQFVKPECGHRIFEYFRHHDLYDRVQVIDGAQAGVQALRDRGHDVVFASACYYGMVDQKARWLEGFAFCEPEPHQNLPPNFVPIMRKHWLPGDVLIDDGAHNIKAWVMDDERRRPAILVDAPYNQDLDMPSLFTRWVTRVRTWPEIVAAVARLSAR